MSTLPQTLGKLAYGLAFCAVLPLLLAGWAIAAAPLVPLPIPDAPWAGSLCVLTGLTLVLGGMADLWFRGHGLPMNAFPPARLVTRGFYRLLPHPIYVGATLTSAGLSLLTRSASGFWLITPVLTLGWLALTWGFENADLRRRFPQRPYRPLLIALPPATGAPPTLPQRLIAAAQAFLPWLLAYEALIYLGPSAAPVSTFLPFEHAWPVWAWSVLPYSACYPFVALVPLVLRTQRQLRAFMLAAWSASALTLFLQLVLPFYAPPRPLLATGFWADWLRTERALDGPAGAFPSFHVVWALLAADFYARRFPAWRWPAFAMALLITGSCLSTGMHSLPDVAAGAAVFLLARKPVAIWSRLRAALERLANSWACWQLGPVRIINHSLYAGLAMATGTALLCALLGTWVPVAFIVAGGLLGAGLWGQLVEGGRHGLSRPFGYYGSVLGGLLGAQLAASWLPVSLTQLLAAIALVSPIVQAIGRLRCVIQGCCHGHCAPARLGIRVRHPKSRVVAVSGLLNQPIHATAAYSMAANLLLAGLLGRLWYEGAATPLLAGLYCILAGAARFVEEAYRGETQTPIAAGLKLYQWLALLSVLTGLALTLLPPVPLPATLTWQPAFGFLALTTGLLAAFAMGVDFPLSNRRFSRLAG